MMTDATTDAAPTLDDLTAAELRAMLTENPDQQTFSTADLERYHDAEAADR